ncbi:hypothetical protein SAY86_023967 [Trapa natans]|uniref:Uncharacterized protein n=1 Tax=Trapa natans TaxID=22666 RepID=A0AAN7R8D6_TRANT|nr:hypothetical protein SAY86_023967 [Trapa natans]
MPKRPLLDFPNLHNLTSSLLNQTVVKNDLLVLNHLNQLIFITFERYWTSEKTYHLEPLKKQEEPKMVGKVQLGRQYFVPIILILTAARTSALCVKTTSAVP